MTQSWKAAPESSSSSESDLLRCLGSSPILGGLDEPVRRKIVGRLELGWIAAGETLFEKGDRPDALYLIVQGELEAIARRDDGSELVLSKMGPGSLAGEIQVLTSGARSATVRSAVATELGRLSRADLDDLADEHPEILQCIADVIRERLRRDQLVEVLPQLFGPVDETILRDVEEVIEWVHLKRGERLFRRGDRSQFLFILASGRLCAAIDDEAESRVLGEIGRGELIGEIAMFAEEAHTASVYAIRESEVARISYEGFERLVQRHPQLLRAIMAGMAQRMRQLAAPRSPGQGIRNVAVIPLAEDVPIGEFVSRLLAALDQGAPTSHLSSALIDDQLGMVGAAELPDDSPLHIRIGAWMDQLEAEHGLVIYEADPGATRWTHRCIRQADHVVLVAWAAGDPEPNEVERAVMEESEITAAKCRLVLMHPDGSEMPSGTIDWLDKRKVDIHHHLRWDNDADFARLGRFLQGRAVGLVLGGGGARGMAHIGVIRALLESGVPIDAVGGTSAGGLIATQFAMGRDPDSLSLTNRRAFGRHKPFRGFTIPIVSLVGAKRMIEMSRHLYGEVRLEDLWLNCFCVSCDISNAETVVHRTGLAWKAVRATTALPGIAVPVVEGGHLLVDGGVVDNLPGSIMRAVTAGPIVVCDVSPEDVLKVDYAEIPTASSILWSWLAPHLKRLDVPTIGEVMVRTAVISSVKRREETQALASLFLKPPVDEFSLLEFAAFDRLVDVGYSYALERIASWSEREQYVVKEPEEQEQRSSG